MDGDKLYICLEAKGNNNKSLSKNKKKKKKSNKEWKNYYMIFSVKLSDLRTQLPNTPDLQIEQIFDGPPSMGCGRFESKLVFAGGRTVKHKNLITFDLTTQELSSKSFPSMQIHKVKPIVFELNKRLYVADLSSGYRKNAIEYFYPLEKQWHQLPLPDQNFIIKYICKRDNNCPYYSFVVMGNTCCLHMPPLSLSYFHHPNYIYNAWESYEYHPFSGVATCYRQDGYADSVIISLDNGFIRAHQFQVHEGYWGEPIQLFEIMPSKSDTDMSAYFADFEGGIFSLSVSDKSCFYVYTFKISITGEEPDSTLNVKFKLLTQYQIEFNHLPCTTDILGVVGCFASSPNHQAIKSAEEAFEKYMVSFGRRCDDNPKMFEYKGELYHVPERFFDSGSVLHNDR